MTWVVVDDPIPAGASHLGTGLGAPVAHRARRASSARRRALAGLRRARASRASAPTTTSCRRARFTVEYTIRLNQSGRFELPPTRVEALYAPEMFGEMPNAPLEVAP